MSIPKRIEQKVYSGMVLDEHSCWITMAEKIEKELFFLEQLEGGNVIVDGRWIPIGEALSPGTQDNENSKIMEADNPDINNDQNDIPFPPETVTVEFIDKDFPPETTAISIEEYLGDKNEAAKPDSLSSISDSVTTEKTISITPDAYFKEQILNAKLYQSSIVFNSKNLRNKKRNKFTFFLLTVFFIAIITGIYLYGIL
ncbi:MAG TPA: hypothetical protein VKY57_10750 [Chitinispirillaceae bacterium]|nr:hypothetical protein [Chitinispirillaceae bacterium]